MWFVLKVVVCLTSELRRLFSTYDSVHVTYSFIGFVLWISLWGCHSAQWRRNRIRLLVFCGASLLCHCSLLLLLLLDLLGSFYVVSGFWFGLVGPEDDVCGLVVLCARDSSLAWLMPGWSDLCDLCGPHCCWRCASAFAHIQKQLSDDFEWVVLLCVCVCGFCCCGAFVVNVYNVVIMDMKQGAGGWGLETQFTH